LQRFGKTTPGLRKDVGGSLIFRSPNVFGVFLIDLSPVFAML
jgi:hypothetical protein